MQKVRPCYLQVQTGGFALGLGFRVRVGRRGILLSGQGMRQLDDYDSLIRTFINLLYGKE